MTELICGLDEAGRGPLAGPVVAGAVILPENFPLDILADSKKLSEKRRLSAELVIKELSCWGIGIVDCEIIDKINILQASLLAMRQAAESLFKKIPAFLARCSIAPSDIQIIAVADGRHTAEIVSNVYAVYNRAVIKADNKIPAVMAASILAKNERDRIMTEYGAQYPEYGYERHKGYPTAEHRAICRKKGPSPIQRLTFKY